MEGSSRYSILVTCLAVCQSFYIVHSSSSLTNTELILNSIVSVPSIPYSTIQTSSITSTLSKSVKLRSPTIPIQVTLPSASLSDQSNKSIYISNQSNKSIYISKEIKETIAHNINSVLFSYTITPLASHSSSNLELNLSDQSLSQLHTIKPSSTVFNIIKTKILSPTMVAKETLTTIPLVSNNKQSSTRISTKSYPKQSSVSLSTKLLIVNTIQPTKSESTIHVKQTKLSEITQIIKNTEKTIAPSPLKSQNNVKQSDKATNKTQQIENTIQLTASESSNKVLETKIPSSVTTSVPTTARKSVPTSVPISVTKSLTTTASVTTSVPTRVPTLVRTSVPTSTSVATSVTTSVTSSITTSVATPITTTITTTKPITTAVVPVTCTLEGIVTVNKTTSSNATILKSEISQILLAEFQKLNIATFQSLVPGDFTSDYGTAAVFSFNLTFTQEICIGKVKATVLTKEDTFDDKVIGSYRFSYLKIKPYNPVSFNTITIDAKVTLLGDFKQEYTNKLSTEYAELETKMVDGLTKIYKDLTGFVKIVVVGFTPGSIVTEYEVIFNKVQLPTGTSTTTLEENLKTEISSAGFIEGFEILENNIKPTVAPDGKDDIEAWIIILIVAIMLLVLLIIVVCFQRKKLSGLKDILYSGNYGNGRRGVNRRSYKSGIELEQMENEMHLDNTGSVKRAGMNSYTNESYAIS